MTNIFFGIACILGIPLGLGILIGWLKWGRTPIPPPAANRSHRDWLDDEFRRLPMRGILTQHQINELRLIYGISGTSPSTEPATGLVDPLAQTTSEPEADLHAPSPTPVPVERQDLADTSIQPDADDLNERIFPSTLPIAPPLRSEPVSTTPRSPFAPPEVPTHTPPPRSGLHLPKVHAPRIERATLDPAALMLYLGAFLVVAAGIVYASYNWSDLGSGQKLGLLVAATLAFGGTGIGLLSNSRVRQAAETFIAISALLVPANAIAAWSVLDDGEASIPVITLLGAFVTTVVYVAYSIRPGGRAYAYGAGIAALVAIGALPPALGTHVGWSGPAVLLAVAVLVAGSDRLPKAIFHLATPFRHVAMVALPIATASGIAASTDTNEWLGPVTLAAATLAVLAVAHRGPHLVWSTLGTVTALLGLTWSWWIIDPQSSWILMAAALLVAVGLIALCEIAPSWFLQRHMDRVLNGEAILALLVAVATPIDNENAWQMTFGFVLATLISASIPIISQSRMWLLATASFAAGGWFSLAAHANAPDWPEWSRHQYIAGSVVALAIAAYVLDRWSERTARPRWGLAFWTVGGVIAVLHTVSILSLRLDGSEDLPAWAACIAFVGYALIALVAAWSSDMARVRALSGIWLILASFIAVDGLDLLPEDRSSALFLMLGGLCLVLWGRARHDESPPRAWLGPRRADDARLEIPILATAAGLLLVGMVAIAFRYIVSVQADVLPADLASIVWTWIVYLTTFSLATVALVSIGLALPEPTLTPADDTPHRANFAAWLPRLTLLMTALTITLALRMITTDLVVWTWAGLGFALLLVALPLVGQIATSPRWFPRLLASESPHIAAGVLAVSVLANLRLTYNHDIPAEAGQTAVIASFVAIALLGISFRTRWHVAAWLGFGVGTFAVLQATRALTDNDRMVLLALAILAWVVMGAALALPEREPYAIHRPTWRLAALAIGMLAAIAPATLLVDISSNDDDLQIVVIALISLAGLLAVEAILRQDRLRGIIASVIAMAGLLLQITLHDPENILTYTIPVGLYLLALGYVQRRQITFRDALLMAGSGVLLIPALLLAQTEASLGYLWLAGGMSLVLFLVGIVLQLRVLIAAGVIGVTIIVLRMLVEAALALESWITLLVIGLVLLGGGTASLIWKEVLLARLDRLQQSWHDMA